MVVGVTVHPVTRQDFLEPQIEVAAVAAVETLAKKVVMVAQVL
jgi:hypothetical protein